MQQRIHRTIGTITALLLFVAIVLVCPPLSNAATGADRVDARINDLHSKLKITAAQEEQFNKLAQVMRENVAAMEPLIKARKEKGAMNAVDDLKSYSEIQDTQAAGLKNFIAAFEPLYASMSEDQKKEADKIFTHRLEKHMKKKK
ncbi:MAG TPA: Spy/CpxP family protein refolding chaperone [Syntrophorhabdales bacterium]|nr:Spy/CpxP family protein refolding chaperone [Syntrophorhabdales bacterium]